MATGRFKQTALFYFLSHPPVLARYLSPLSHPSLFSMPLFIPVSPFFFLPQLTFFHIPPGPPLILVYLSSLQPPSLAVIPFS